MSRLILAFVRHGDYQQLSDTPSAHQPFALTERGVEQSRAAAIKLRHDIAEQNWHLHPQIECSHMLRAWQTATVFAETIQDSQREQLQITSYDTLAERSVGAAANLTLDQITRIVIDDPRYADLPSGWKADSDFRLPFQGAESLMEAGIRVAEHLTQHMSALVRTEHTQLKLFFGHGASFRHAAFQLGVISRQQIAQLSMFHSQPIFLELLEDGSWRHIAGEWKQRTLNNDGVD